MKIEKLTKKEEPGKYQKPGYIEKERNGEMVYYSNGKDGYVVDEKTGQTREVHEPQGELLTASYLREIPR
jgi:hypothetical protein